MKQTFIALRLCAAAALCGLLGGCAFQSVDELLTAPAPTKNYQALSTELKSIQDRTGAIYTSPESGENRNTIQLKDLDGDGEEEAISFFRDAALSSSFTVYIHKKIGDAYIKMGSVTGSGTSIESVDYPVFTPDGRCGVVIAWRLAGEGATALTVCAFENGQVRPVLETNYAAFELSDLTGDGQKELITLHLDGSRKLARLYRYEEGDMTLAGEAAMTQDAKSVVRIRAGYAAGHVPAVFVEEKNESGVGLITDVFQYREDGFHNIALEAEQSSVASTYRPVSVYATDVNGDGVTEIPRAHLLAGYQIGASDALYLLDWYVYGEERPRLALTTYFSQVEEWMLRTPDAWHDRVTVTKSTQNNGVSCTRFSEYQPGGASIPLLDVYCLTGEMRSYYAASGGMYVLRETSSAIYTYQIPEAAAGSALAIGGPEVESRFSVLAQEWSR